MRMGGTGLTNGCSSIGMLCNKRESNHNPVDVIFKSHEEMQGCNDSKQSMLLGRCECNKYGGWVQES